MPYWKGHVRRCSLQMPGVGDGDPQRQQSSNVTTLGLFMRKLACAKSRTKVHAPILKSFVLCGPNTIH